MAIELILGPPNSGRAEAILAAYRAALGRDPVLVLPTADDVARFEQELCASEGTVVGGSIATFSGLIAEIAARVAPALGPRLGEAQRDALIRAAIARARPRHLRRSSARPGFGPALGALIEELQAALIGPDEFDRIVGELEDPGHERELADLYRAYTELRELSGGADAATVARAALDGLRARPELWGGRPAFVYGFDDLTRVQIELLAELARTSDVAVAVTWADSEALKARSSLVNVFTEELGATLPSPLPFDPSYTKSATLRHLDRFLFEPAADGVEPDDGLVLMASAGARCEAEAIGIEIARLIESGSEPDEIAIVVRHPDSAGPLLARVLSGLGLPVALEASTPLAGTAVGRSLIALCGAARDDANVGALIAHLRADPGVEPGVVDWLERKVRRGDARTVSEAIEGWERSPRHLARVREAQDAAGRLLALAASAREIAESAHRGEAPLATSRTPPERRPFSAVEARAGVVAADLLEELAGIGSLPGCEQPDLEGAIEALDGARVPFWRGPAPGRVRILSPYRARGIRVRYLFCASLQDGEFPSATPPDPLLSEERRRAIGHPELRREDPADEERYLFHSCVSRPTERLYLSWQSADEDGAALARSPFVDEVLDVLGEREIPIRVRGPERSVPTPEEATSARALARALAVGGWNAGRDETLERLGVGKAVAEAVEALFSTIPDPGALPGPLSNPVVLADLGGREVFSANSLERWVECPYRWFVDHELSPQRLEPESDPLWIGSIVHDALERLYREPPGADSIPRPGDLGRWRSRFAELLEEAATRSAGSPTPARRAGLDRARVQVDAFLAQEAESESEFRPRPELLELSFGPFEEAGGEPGHEALPIGEVSLRGRIDRIDVAEDGRAAIVRDYKTGKSVTPADKFADKGTLQIQLYMRVARDRLGLDPVAGLYHPLGATSDRRPRGLLDREDERLEPVAAVSRDRVERDTFETYLDDAVARAAQAAREMRAGEIGRRPLNGECPPYCTFQAICRLERAVGAVGDESAKGGNGG